MRLNNGGDHRELALGTLMRCLEVFPEAFAGVLGV